MNPSVFCAEDRVTCFFNPTTMKSIHTIIFGGSSLELERIMAEGAGLIGGERISKSSLNKDQVSVELIRVRSSPLGIHVVNINMSHSQTTCTTVHHSALQCTTVHHSAPQCTTVYHSALQCTTVHHSAPQCTTVYHSAPQCTTVYHSVPQCTTVYHSVPQCTTVYHSVPQCTTVYHSVPQCTTVYYSLVQTKAFDSWFDDKTVKHY